MSKKLIAILVTALICGAFAGSSVFAGDVTTAFIELKSNDVEAIVGGVLRGRLTLLDAAGVRATTINGSPISEAVVEIESVNYSGKAGFAEVKVNAADPVTFDTSSKFTMTLTNSSDEFAVNYPGANLTEAGTDTLRVTVKKSTTTVATKDAPVIITLPAMNAYVVRTGGVSPLPGVLDEIPAAQADKGATRPAGDKVQIDVFAAYYDGSKFYFTTNVPAGAETVGITGSSSNIPLWNTGATLVDGHAALELQVTNLNIPTLLTGTTAATQATNLQSLIQGVVITFMAASKVSRDDIGDKQADIFQAAENPDPIIQLNYSEQNFGYYGLSGSDYKDTAKFVPASFSKISVVGLPINAITSTVGIYNYIGDGDAQSACPLDAYNFVAKPTQAKPSQNKFFAPGNSSGYVLGAILGWDSYDNPAPFNKTGASAPFKLMETVSPINEGTWYTSAADGTGIVITPVANNPFIPFQVFDSSSGTKVYFDPTYTGTSTAVKNAVTNIDTLAEGVLYDVKSFAELGYTAPAVTNDSFIGIQVANDEVNIKADGFGGDELNLRMVNKDGKKVKINHKDTFEAADSVIIPLADQDDVNKAEDDLLVFTSLATNGSGTPAATSIIRGIFETTDQNASFVAIAPETLTTGIYPADPGDFPPTSVSSRMGTASVLLDNGDDHDTVGFFPTKNVTILDAFGNSYVTAGTLEDAEPVVKVLKEDGTTTFPGSSTDVSNNLVTFSINPGSVAPDAQKAIVNIAAGSGSANVTVNVRALQKTILDSIYVPIPGLEAPVNIFFGDQNADIIPPVSNATADGSFDIETEVTDGLLGGAAKPTFTIETSTPNEIAYAKPNSGKTSMTIEADGGDADASNTTLTLTFAAVDTTPPTIGAVTAGTCSVTVAFTDDKGLNLAGSTIVVKNSSGTDITSQLTGPTITGDGTTAGTISYSGIPVGLYTLDIVAKDTAGNMTSEQRPANVTTCAPGSCLSVSPSYAVIGTELTLDVTITGENTNFSAASTVAFSCPGITVNSVNATSATTIVATITIAADAAAGKCDVTVTTGLEEIICSQAFELTENIIVPSCVSISPSTVTAGDSTDVTITLQDIDLTKVTSALSVSFGCTGVTVTSSTVNVLSATQLKVSITVAENAQDCTGDVTITGAADVGVVCKNKFTVEAIPQCSLNISPSPFRNGIILPRFRVFTITGTNSAWTSSSTVTIQGIRVLAKLSSSASEIKVLAFVPSKIRLAAGSKTVTVTTGTDVCTGTLVIE